MTTPNNDDNANSPRSDKPENWIDYKKLPLVRARIKFYNMADKFGFVTLLDENDAPIQDAYLAGILLDRAGIYQVEPDQILEVKHAPKPKGEAVVYVERRKADYEGSLKALIKKQQNDD